MTIYDSLTDHKSQANGRERVCLCTPEVTVLQTIEGIVTELVFIAKDRQLIKKMTNELELSRGMEMMTRVWYRRCHVGVEGD